MQYASSYKLGEINRTNVWLYLQFVCSGELLARSVSGGKKNKKTSAILLMAFYSRCVYS